MMNTPLPTRKRTRLEQYDYSTPGAYFITICTHERKNVLSKIVGGDGLAAARSRSGSDNTPVLSFKTLTPLRYSTTRKQEGTNHLADVYTSADNRSPAKELAVAPTLLCYKGITLTSYAKSYRFALQNEFESFIGIKQNRGTTRVPLLCLVQ